MTDINDLERGFHNRDGWYFSRDSESGDVRIWQVRYERLPCDCTDKPCCAAPTCASHRFAAVGFAAGPLVIPENEWASIVTSVSANSETAASWQFIRDFHSGKLRAEAGAPPMPETKERP